jgi:cell division protein ZapA (FtsZ GTPase activity inhibitor)
MEEEKISIKVNVVDRNYPFKITANYEEKMRAAARRINDQVALYRQHYAGCDAQDALSMAAIQFVVKLIVQEDKMKDAERVIDDFVAIDNRLEEYLQTVEE